MVSLDLSYLNITMTDAVVHAGGKRVQQLLL